MNRAVSTTHPAAGRAVRLPIQGMDCASCAAKIERALSAVPGVDRVMVNFAVEEATVTLAPGGLHLMLMGLKAPLVEGETVPVTLTFANAGTVEIGLSVHAPVIFGDARRQILSLPLLDIEF